MTFTLEKIGDSHSEFFAPAATDLLDNLIGQYRGTLELIDQAAALFAGDMGGVVHYFMAGNGTGQRGYSSLAAEQVFQRKGAVAALNAAYWSKALALTDVLDVMPQKRRDEWNVQIIEMTTPDFVEDAVRPTISGLLASRQLFLGERVDGIFRALSGEHVTNSPRGFGKRMIIGGVLDSYGLSEYRRVGYINDLRGVIAKFMGRGEIKHYASNSLIDNLKGQWGEWVNLDGGALRIRLYRKGTAHLEVHPEMAWRLNQILAFLHPLAIPAEHRTKPAKPIKAFALMQRPLPFSVTEILSSASGRRNSNQVLLTTSLRAQNLAAWSEACRVIESLGGVGVSLGCFDFDYPVLDVINEIALTGCVPDKVSHQYYPTPELVACVAIEMAEIGPDDQCLEPSAGQGGLADHMPKDRTLCVEVSALHCKVLAAKGYATFCEDFLMWKSPRTFDRIILNPPFSEGRWQAHLAHAARMVAKGGRLVAVLPGSARGKPALPGFDLTWSRVFTDEFEGTSISVVILGASPCAASHHDQQGHHDAAT